MQKLKVKIIFVITFVIILSTGIFVLNENQNIFPFTASQNKVTKSTLNNINNNENAFKDEKPLKKDNDSLKPYHCDKDNLKFGVSIPNNISAFSEEMSEKLLVYYKMMLV